MGQLLPDNYHAGAGPDFASSRGESLGVLARSADLRDRARGLTRFSDRATRCLTGKPAGSYRVLVIPPVRRHALGYSGEP
jgi:hypothetical protein